MGVEEGEKFGEFEMAISITLQGGTGDTDAYQRRGRIVPVPESDCFH
jgi:hypothetical protein